MRKLDSHLLYNEDRESKGRGPGLSEQDNFTKVLDKLAESFDDFKERLIRIEENIKDVKHVKTDVEELKIKYAALESKTNSAHKRVDGIAEKVPEHAEERIKRLEANQRWVATAIIGAVIIAVMGLVLIQQ